MNRLYYSCFYAVTSLLLSHGLSSAKHTGVRSLFNRTFVKTGIIPLHLGSLFNELFQKRQESDYMDHKIFVAEQVLPLIDGTDEFVRKIFELIPYIGKS